MDKEFVKELCKNRLEYMFIGSLISSDNILTQKDAIDALNQISELEKSIDESELDKTKKDELNGFILKAKDILNSDINRFKEMGS